ncbi:MAG: ABC transporter permease, partial [SAR324 cluster bacterium]|nr:ABC transporter permease [SAR324 cluster bacterium]
MPPWILDNVDRKSTLSTLLQISPISLILGFFLVLPIGTILIVSFWDYNDFSFFPDFVWTNYSDALGSNVTYKTYLNTFWYAGLTWFCTFLIGFTVAYFLAFHIHTTRWQIVLFLICTIPFWTSN